MNYGLIGEKLGHSFSAEIHSRLGGYDYELKEIPQCGLVDFIQKRDFSAINVTIPYKEQVIPLLDNVSDTAKRIGAVNTIVNRNGVLYGYNTDYSGLKELIIRTGISLADKTVLVLGSGGTSKTAAAVAEDMGCYRVVRVSRSVKDGCITYLQAKEQFSHADVLINTTPCGMYPHLGESAIELQDFPTVQGVIDVVYNPLRTKLVCDAQAKGIVAVGGLYMLVAQAAYAAELFTDTKISTDRIYRAYEELVSKKENIVLIGMPGCGKTTVGRVLADRCGMQFVDTDDEIVRQEGRSIPEIFTTDGEEYFRRLERDTVYWLSARQGCLIATGGGVVLNPANMAALRQNGRIYFLDRPLEELCATADRPLSADRTALEKRYAERYELYCQYCDRHIHTTGNVEDVTNQIIEDLMG